MSETATENFRIGNRENALSDKVLPLGHARALQSAGAAFHALADTMPQIVWSTMPDGSHDYYNAQWYAFTGVPEGSTDGDGWADLFHPHDQERARERWNHSLTTGEPYEVEYRLRHHSGEYRWMIGRALPILGQDDQIRRWIGTCTDIEEQKRTALQNEILSRELSHRIKNIFSVISSLIGLTARSNQALGKVSGELLARIAALGRAHEFVRPHSEASRPEPVDVLLTTLLKTIFETYPAWSQGRITISGPAITVDSRAATPVALVFHELATNAMKYGALSKAEGRVSIEIEEQGDVVDIVWTESGGPRVAEPEMGDGFGSRLIDMAIRLQLGGSYERSFRANGLMLKMRVKRGRLVKTG